MIALLLAGIAAFLAGVISVAYGLPIKEFSFGNTMILVGAVLSCTGLLLIGLGLVLRELRRLTHGLRGGAGLSPLPDAEVVTIATAQLTHRGDGEPEKSSRAQPGNGDFLFTRDDPHDASSFADDAPAAFSTREESGAADIAPGVAPALQWPDEPGFEPSRVPPREQRSRPPLPPRPERAEPAAASASRPRRDFLFSSRRAERASAAEATESAPVKDTPRRSEPTIASAQETFEAAWQQPDSDYHPEPPRENLRAAPPRFSRREEPAVSVVKSGVVDTMAYSLYSDGSIEAQLPEGTVRFESIDELRAHLDQRG